MGKEVKLDTSDIDLSPLKAPVNTKDTELAPTFLNDLFVFTSLKADSIKITEEVLSDDYSLQLYQATKNENEFSNVKPLKGIKLKGFHAANGTLSIDGRRFYFSRCDQNLNCKIFIGEVKGDEIINIDSLGEIINFEGARTTMPHIANVSGAEYLFFVSDRPKSIGGLDIWYSKVKNGNQYSKPINLGRRINSLDDDISPFYDPKTEQLYFSTSWHSGFGGHDIFSTKKMPSLLKFSSPVNMDYP